MNANVNQEVFALWSLDGFYYPGVIVGVQSSQANVLFNDGFAAWVDLSEIVEPDYALNNLQLQGNWQQLGAYYPCRPVGQLGESLHVLYEDGGEETIALSQLRVVGAQASLATDIPTAFGMGNMSMICKCGSDNVNVMAVAEQKSRGCLTSLIWIALAILTVGMIIWIPLLIKKGSRTVTYAICQSCGRRWVV